MRTTPNLFKHDNNTDVEQRLVSRVIRKGDSVKVDVVDPFNLQPRVTAISLVCPIRVCQNQQPAGEHIVLKNLSSRCSKADPNSIEDLDSGQGGSKLVSRLRDSECIALI